MILVSGGAGVMGSRLVKILAAAGNRVRVLTLPQDPNVSRLKEIDCEVVCGDVSDASSLKGFFEGVQTVYHLAAVIIAYERSVFEKINIQGTRNMVNGAAAAGVRHFVYVSSASVTFPHASDYAWSKMEAERATTSQTAMHYTIVRPTLVYDKDGGQEFLMFMDYLKRYPIVPFVGWGRQIKNPVFAQDVVRGLAAIANNPKAYGKTYNFSGGEAIKIRDMARLMLKHQGLSKLFVPIPFFLCKMAAFLMEKTMQRPPLTRYAITRMEQDADLDNSAARNDLGFNPMGITEGLQKCFPLPSQGES